MVYNSGTGSNRGKGFFLKKRKKSILISSDNLNNLETKKNVEEIPVPV